MWVNFSIAVLLTCLPIAVILARTIDPGTPGRTACILGYSLLLGIVGITALMRIFNLLNIPLSFWGLGGAWAAISLLATLIPREARPTKDTAAMPKLAPSVTALPGKLGIFITVVCLALIALRLYSLGLESLLRPTFAWDSKQHWGLVAREIFELREIRQYIGRIDWLEGDSSSYTNLHPSYPLTVPLTQAWFALALGVWDESAAGAPWLLFYVALGSIFYAQSRIAGAGIPLATVGTYMLLSLPYLNIQVALPGYADLFLACVFLGAVSSLYNWGNHQARWQLGLCAACAVTCVTVKQEGFFWLLSILPAVLLIRIGWRRSLPVFAFALVLVLLLLFFLPPTTVIAGQSLEAIDLRYRPAGWQPIYFSLLVHDNWHLLVYLFLLALPTLFVLKDDLPLHAIGLCLLCAFGLYVILFIATDRVSGAVTYTAINRVGLQLMPSVAFFTLQVFSSLANQRGMTLSSSNN